MFALQVVTGIGSVRLNVQITLTGMQKLRASALGGSHYDCCNDCCYSQTFLYSFFLLNSTGLQG